MQERSRQSGASSALLDWRFLSALVLLGLNDWWFKAAFGSWVTGKLSDFAGLIVLPIVVCVALRLRGGAGRAAVFGTVGVWFAAMKTVPAVAVGTELLAEMVTRQPSTIVVDPGDLAALVSLALAWRILAMPQPVRLDRRSLRVGVFIAAAFLCTATSSAEPFLGTDLGLSENGAVVSDRDWNYDAPLVPMVSGQGISELACTRDETVCVRIVDDRLEESLDGSPFDTVWAFDVSSPLSVGELNFNHDPAHRGVLDIIAAPNGTVHALLGGYGPIVRSVDGEWTPSFSTFRPSGQVVFLSVYFFVAILLLLGAAAGKTNTFGLVICGLGAVIVLAGAMVGSDEGVGEFVWLLAAVPMLFISAAIGIAGTLVQLAGLGPKRTKMLAVILASTLLGSVMTGLGLVFFITVPVAAAIFFAVQRTEIRRPNAASLLRFGAALGLAILSMVLPIFPMRWWKQSVDASFWVAFPLALLLGIGVVIAAFIVRRRFFASDAQEPLMPPPPPVGATPVLPPAF